jgi:outer membrane protein OmpA-like peptidoglycan-associated protein
VIVSVLLLTVTLFFSFNADAQNLGANVNTDGDEYINALLSDGSRIYFTRRQGDDKVFFSVVKDGNCQLAQPVDFGWTHDIRMGAVSFSADMKTVYFVGIEYPGGFGRGDIYKSELIDNKWGNLINLGLPVNSATMESQPCISANGKELYFVRDTKNYKSNIYCSRRLADGRWDKPSAVTAANTRFGERAPFLHPDGQTLFFASEGHDGLGGYDIFVCRRLLGGGWSEPVNLGAPVNTEKNEISFVVSADGKKCYVSSDRDGGFGGYDIYVFDYKAINVPEIVDTTHFVMRNIQFEFDSAVIDTIASGPELDSLAYYMTENPNIRIEISGYTDNTGDSAHNKTLSVERAEAVKNAMIERGIEADRMEANGYGENRPLVPNINEKNKGINRRVEVRVIY